MKDLENAVISFKKLFKDVKKGDYNDLLEFTFKQYREENSVPDIYNSAMKKHWYNSMLKSLQFIKDKYEIKLSSDEDYKHFFGEIK